MSRSQALTVAKALAEISEELKAKYTIRFLFELMAIRRGCRLCILVGVCLLGDLSHAEEVVQRLVSVLLDLRMPIAIHSSQPNEPQTKVEKSARTPVNTCGCVRPRFVPYSVKKTSLTVMAPHASHVKSCSER